MENKEKRAQMGWLSWLEYQLLYQKDCRFNPMLGYVWEATDRSLAQINKHILG